MQPILFRELPGVIEMNDTRNEPEFTDHYYTLGIDIDASGEVVEETYWQRIRTSRLDESGSSAGPQDIEDLNEAYRVLMTPQLRRFYDAERAKVLGVDAAPRAPQPRCPEPPLRVMEKQMSALLKQADTGEEVATGGWSLPLSARLLAGSVTFFGTGTFLAMRWLFF